MRRAAILLLVSTVVAIPACSLEAASGSRDQVMATPVLDAEGHTTELQTRVCRPPSEEPRRLVVIAHGSPPDAAERPTMQLTPCSNEAVRWFLERGYVVALALRRGYGATGGAWAEAYRTCSADGFAAAGRETARDIQAVVDAVTRLPFVQPEGAIVVGQSAGGWGTVALDSQPHPHVAAMVSMAGGRGGHQDGIPNRNCHPEELAGAAGRYGGTATTPMLWVYAANDSFFAPGIAASLHAAFTSAGGDARLEQPGAYGQDGHRLFFGRGGSAIWGPMVEAYLVQQHVSAP